MTAPPAKVPTGQLPPVTMTFPTRLTITTVLTGAVIWYLAVALCVPGTDRPGLALAVPGDEPAPGDDEDDAHPARPSPAVPSNTMTSATDPARRMAGVAPRARSIRENPAYSSNRPPRYLARKRSAAA